MESKHARQSKPLVLATDRLVNVTLSGRDGNDSYRDTPASVYLNICKETVITVFYLSLLLVSGIAHHSVPVVNRPTVWCWSGDSKESASLR